MMCERYARGGVIDAVYGTSPPTAMGKVQANAEQAKVIE